MGNFGADVGARGVGETIFLLRRISDTPDFLRSALYVSLDSIHASRIQLYALADQFRMSRGTPFSPPMGIENSPTRPILRLLRTDEAGFQLLFSRYELPRMFSVTA